MQFRDLQKQYQVLKTDIDAAMQQVAESAAYVGGPQVAAIQEELADYVGVKHVITCGSGTDALELSMMALGLEKNDAVFVPDFTFFASGETVPRAGAVPIFVDVEEDTFNMDPVKLEEMVVRIKEEGKYNPKIVIVVDLYGLPANMAAIRQVCNKYGLYLVEDAAQGFGGTMDGQRACSFGDIAATSFFPTKPLGCYGDGGAVFTNNDEWASLFRSLQVHGKGKDKYDNVRIGFNSRLDTIQAAILQIKLKAFKDYELADVNKAAGYYDALLKDIVATPVIPAGYGSSWAQYTIRLANEEQRDGLQAFLKEKGIPSMIYYTKPMHKQTAFDTSMYDDGDFTVTEKLCKTVLSLPIHPYLTEAEAQEVAAAIKEYLGK